MPTTNHTLRVDLHGMYVEDAMDFLFLHRHYSSNYICYDKETELHHTRRSARTYHTGECTNDNI